MSQVRLSVSKLLYTAARKDRQSTQWRGGKVKDLEAVQRGTKPEMEPPGIGLVARLGLVRGLGGPDKAKPACALQP